MFKANGNVVTWYPLRPLPMHELNREKEEKKSETPDTLIDRIRGT